MLASLNSYFHFIGRQEYCVRTFRVQKRIFCDERREMTRSDYQKLVKAARGRGDERLCAILQTIASTGIRISELSYITAESLAQGEVVIDCKGKQRVILLPCNPSRRSRVPLSVNISVIPAVMHWWFMTTFPNRPLPTAKCP